MPEKYGFRWDTGRSSRRFTGPSTQKGMLNRRGLFWPEVPSVQHAAKRRTSCFFLIFQVNFQLSAGTGSFFAADM